MVISRIVNCRAVLLNQNNISIPESVPINKIITQKAVMQIYYQFICLGEAKERPSDPLLLYELWWKIIFENY